MEDLLVRDRIWGGGRDREGPVPKGCLFGGSRLMLEVNKDRSAKSGDHESLESKRGNKS